MQGTLTFLEIIKGRVEVPTEPGSRLRSRQKTGGKWSVWLRGKPTVGKSKSLVQIPLCSLTGQGT